MNSKVMTLCFSLLGSSAVAENPEWSKIERHEWEMAAPELHPEAGAVVLFDHGTLDVSPSQIVRNQHVRIKILKKSGISEIGESEIWYWDSDKITDLKAQTISPSGGKTEVASKNIFTKRAGDLRIKTFSFPTLDSGCIVEYRYKLTSTNFAALRPWYFQTHLFTLESQFALTLWPGFVYNSSLANAPAGVNAPLEEELTNIDNLSLPLKRFTWKQVNLLPVKDEPYMGAKEDYQSALRCQLVSYTDQYSFVPFARDWKEVGQSAAKYFELYNVGGKPKEIVAPFLADNLAPIDLARKLYEHVANTYSLTDDYESWLLGHETRGDFLKMGSGTHGDKNLLLVTLLNEAGIEAWPVLISTREHGRLNVKSTHLSQFDRLIAFVQFDSSIVYLDAGNKYCPFGILPPECLAEAGLLIDGKKSELVRILRNEPRTVRLDVTHMSIDSVDNVSCSTKCTLSGYFAPEYGALYQELSADEFVWGTILESCDDATHNEEPAVLVDSVGRLQVVAKYTLPNALQTIGDGRLISPVSLAFADNPFKSLKRFFPVDFSFPFTYHSIVYVTSSGTITQAELPEPLTLSMDGAQFVRSVQLLDGQLIVQSKLTLTEPVFPPARYSEVRNFFEQVAATQGGDIQLGLQ